MIKGKKERLLKRYVKLEKLNKKMEVKCPVFCEIKDSIRNKDQDRLYSAIKKHSGLRATETKKVDWRVSDEDVAWIVIEAMKIFKDEAEHIERLEAIQVDYERLKSEPSHEGDDINNSTSSIT